MVAIGPVWWYELALGSGMVLVIAGAIGGQAAVSVQTSGQSVVPHVSLLQALSVSPVSGWGRATEPSMSLSAENVLGIV